jgi:plastocyanin
MRLPSLLIAALVTTGALGACGGGDDSSSSATTTTTVAAAQDQSTVNIKTFAFQPNPLKVKTGATVTWNNDDDILHTVTSGTRGKADGMFDSKLDGPDATATFTFTEAGTFSYHCTIHPGMDATVVVS